VPTTLPTGTLVGTVTTEVGRHGAGRHDRRPVAAAVERAAAPTTPTWRSATARAGGAEVGTVWCGAPRHGVDDRAS
jgi:hypothetical protein